MLPVFAPLAPLLVGDYSLLRDMMVLPDDPRPAIPGAEFLQAETMDRLLGQFIENYGEQQVIGDNRAFASLWSRHYFLRVIPLAAAASLLFNWRLPVAIDEIAIIVDDSGIPEAIRLPHAGEAFRIDDGDPNSGFAELLDGNVSLFIDVLAGLVKIAPRALWSSAGDYFEKMLSVLEKAPDIDTTNLEAGRQLLASEFLGDGRRNPLFEPVRYVPVINDEGRSELQRLRRVCCVRYMLPTLGYCEDCPHMHERRLKIAARDKARQLAAQNVSEIVT